MSKAGIQSNRGDGYQTLVAFEWAITVLSDPTYEWLEVDAATLQIDDIVVGKTDGTKICCQCKKNQTSHQSWSTADLADELQKASQLLSGDSTASVRFYSRSPFGEIAALREYCTTYPDEASYKANLGKANKAIDSKLESLLMRCTPKISTYDFLRRVTFETSSELDRMRTLLHERLRHLASNSDAAFDVLWTRLDLLGMRADIHHGKNAALQHRLTKADLQSILYASGSVLALPINLKEVRSSFESTSSIGRSWCRDIVGEKIPTPLVFEILNAIDKKPSSILITGQPGSGKTCVMLALQDTLEQKIPCRSDRFPIFIQSREFADLTTAQDRQAQGLPQDWVERVARMAEIVHVVVVIDSLDVLSIAREHKVLDYFLAQMDRLLMLSNVTLITACREFDRLYDRRIAQRKWSHEFKCQPLNWTKDVVPLLAKQGIEISDIDEITRQLIKNPRELSLYVELARRAGSFSVVTSQALAQKYLNTIVQADIALGDVAMQAIEDIATEMLRLRSVSVPSQRLTTSDTVRRLLLSQNVLQQTQDGKLIFGHQTLLDVLVISDALRLGKTLNAFISELPPVPFVRPSIRSFMAQLATGDRKSFRSELRTAIYSQHPFHIRRLVAECFSEQIPQDNDWPLLRELRSQHFDIFQVIYTHATRLEWHHFWMKHMIPILKFQRDSDGMKMHFHRISKWQDDDPAGVIAFWDETLDIDWIDTTNLNRQLAFSLKHINKAHIQLVAPLLKRLLKMPWEKHSYLGHVLADCVDAGVLDDSTLWMYITSEVSNEDVRGYQFGKNLHCEPHEFGEANERFLTQRMKASSTLLNIAVDAVEQWSKSSPYGKNRAYWSGFLRETSYKDAHSQQDLRHIDRERILFDAIEAAIIQHAIDDSDWWHCNRERLCQNSEGSLRYFSILACTAASTTNPDQIARLLCDADLLESDLSFELGTLIEIAFIDLDPVIQDAIQSKILNIYKTEANDKNHINWKIHQQAQLALSIPCYLRLPAIQSILETAEHSTWPITRQPSINSSGGMVSAPFSFEIFLRCSDSAVLNLLTHYDGYQNNSFDDFLIGGEREVGTQLQEAASRHPSRFIALLTNSWNNIPEKFRDDLINGASTYLSIRHGNLRSNENWKAIEEANTEVLAQSVLNVLESHPNHWHHNREAAKALQACSHVSSDTQTAARFAHLANGFIDFLELDPISGDSVDLLTLGINMAKGNAADALINLITGFSEKSIPWPELLESQLSNFASDNHPAVRAVILRRLPYLQSLAPNLGWTLFEIAMQKTSIGLWAMAEPCLYYAYHQHFERVDPWLEELQINGSGKDLETWGRISALAALSSKVDFNVLLEKLKAIGTSEAWRGAASVWSHSDNYQRHNMQCREGLGAGMAPENLHAAVVAKKFRRLFQDTKEIAIIPKPLLNRCFQCLEEETNPDRGEIYGFEAWLNITSQNDPCEALDISEIFLKFLQRTDSKIYDHEDNLTQLLTHLFSHAEEIEQLDGGAMIQRVVAIQDKLLALGVNGISDWLKAAERQ